MKNETKELKIYERWENDVLPRITSPITEIKFSLFSYESYGCECEILIDFTDDKCTINYSEQQKFKIYEPVTLGIEDSKELYSTISMLQLDKWKRKYEPKICIMDGKEWNLRITFANGKRKYSKGINAYPSRFGNLLYVIKYEIKAKYLAKEK